MQFTVLAEAFQKIEDTSSRLAMTDLLADLFKKAGKGDHERIVYLLQGRVAPPFLPIEIGMGEKFVEQAIALATGYPVADVVKSFKKTGDLGLTAQELISKKKQRSLASKSLTVEHVSTTFYKIATTGGQGSQETKIKLLTELLNNAEPLEAKFLARVPVGQLRLGIGDPTVLDAFSVAEVGDKSLREPLERAYNLCSDLGLVTRTFFEQGVEGVKKFRVHVGSPLRPALAERLSTAEEIMEKVPDALIDAKLDGFRLQVHKNGKRVELFSRRLENVTHMFPEIVSAARELKQEKLIFEGEALSFNEETSEYSSFQQTIQRKRKHGVAEMAKQFPLRLFVFDLIFVNGDDLTGKPFKERRALMEKVFKKQGTLRLMELARVKNARALDAFFKDCISRGLEGIIAKDPNASYTAGARKYAWIKLKRSYQGELADTIDAVIIGYFRGTGARREFGFGGLLTAVFDEKDGKFKSVSRVGTGFSEEQMVELRKMLEKIKSKEKPKSVDSLVVPDFWVQPKLVVALNADEITESPMHTAGRAAGSETGVALRFPRMIGYRFDKAPQDATTVKEIVKLFKMQKRTSLSDAA